MRYGNFIVKTRNAVDALCGLVGKARPITHECSTPSVYTGPTGTLLPPTNLDLTAQADADPNLLKSPTALSLLINLPSVASLLKAPSRLELSLNIPLPTGLRPPTKLTADLSL